MANHFAQSKHMQFLNLEDFCGVLSELLNPLMETHAGNDIHTGLHPTLGNIILICAFGREGGLMIPDNEPGRTRPLEVEHKRGTVSASKQNKED